MQPTNPHNLKSDEAGENGQWAISHPVLFHRLASGWRPTAADVVRDFLARWSKRLKSEIEVREVGESHVVFTCDLGAICFAGMNDTACLLVAGEPTAIEIAAHSFWSHYNTPGRALITIATSPIAEAVIRSCLPYGRQTVLGPKLAVAVLESDAPLRLLKQIIRNQVSRRRLIPFDTEHPTDGHMFRGRTHVLDRLLKEDSVSFAIAGPGRIGKTSLLRYFLNRVQKSPARSRRSRYYIDLMPCQDRTPDGLARFIALKVDRSSSISHLTSSRLEQFFFFHRTHKGQPVDLLLDETDEFLGLEVFRSLCTAASKGLCRLLLAGRGNLLQMALQRDSRLDYRIQLLRLDPLCETDVESLFLSPLRDLGFGITNKRIIVKMLLALTGQLPQYVQYYGRRICEIAIDGNLQTISPTLVKQVRDEFETMQVFSSPLSEVRDPRTRFVGLALLRSGNNSMTLPQMQGLIRKEGLPLAPTEVREIANELVIQNILVWNGGKFRVSSGSLAYHAQGYDFFGSAIPELWVRRPFSS